MSPSATVVSGPGSCFIGTGGRRRHTGVTGLVTGLTACTGVGSGLADASNTSLGSVAETAIGTVGIYRAEDGEDGTSLVTIIGIVQLDVSAGSLGGFKQTGKGVVIQTRSTHALLDT